MVTLPANTLYGNCNLEKNYFKIVVRCIVRPSLDMLMRIIRVAKFTDNLRPEQFLTLAGFEPVDNPMAQHCKAEEEIRNFVASSLMFSGEQINGAYIEP